MDSDMNFLLDENLHPKTCHLLREMGFYTRHVHADDLSFAVGKSDDEIYALAQKNNSIIITLNREHFSNFDPSLCGGILLLKVKPATADKINEALTKLFARDFSEFFPHKSIIVTLMHDGTIKIRPVRK
ncbi:MAG TPA: DUF5615 family PIN-like protein [Spirochaetia bacterium]|nr:DUF5615 family PIN-like protein [Spirochaetia bacterium]